MRRPGQPWSAAQLVVLNENRKFAPDREQQTIGSDNNYEYKLGGYFSGDRVDELVSNRFMAEFVLQNYELISTNPPPFSEASSVAARRDVSRSRAPVNVALCAPPRQRPRHNTITALCKGNRLPWIAGEAKLR